MDDEGTFTTDLYLSLLCTCDRQCTGVAPWLVLHCRNQILKAAGPNQMKPHREVATSPMETSSGSKQDMPPLTHFEVPLAHPVKERGIGKLWTGKRQERTTWNEGNSWNPVGSRWRKCWWATATRLKIQTGKRHFPPRQAKPSKRTVCEV